MVEQERLLVDSNEYLKSGIHIGTKFKTKYMANFIYKTWPDKNAIDDAVRVGIPVIALCDTNNQSNNIDLVVPCNNKGKKSVGLLFYLIAKEYMLKRGLLAGAEEMPAKLDEFVEE